MTDHIFRPADILLPVDTDIEKWSVIACDQFSSSPDYWHETAQITLGAPSTYRLIIPEALLRDSGAENVIINDTMRGYLDAGILRGYPESFVYVERSLSTGDVRRGLVGMLDLEAYDYAEGTLAPVRATEGTDMSRLPPRLAVRRDAPLELPHILLLADDEKMGLIAPLSEKKDELEPLYDFELMQGGGHIRGWRVTGRQAEDVLGAFSSLFESRRRENPNAMLIAAGDGNHSLAAAKQHWEEVKAALSGSARETHPARFALAELTNIRDASLEFRPIHRAVCGCDADALMAALRSHLSRREGEVATAGYRHAHGHGELEVPCAPGELAVGVIQDFLDDYLGANPGRIDYIHGGAQAERLAEAEGCVAFIFTGIEKPQLFDSVEKRGKLPKKTFSMGRATDKRYYLECRSLIPD